MAMNSAKLTSSESVYIKFCFQFSNVLIVARRMLAMIQVVVAASLPKPSLRLTVCAKGRQECQ